MKSNRQKLTHGAKKYSKKRQEKQEQIESVVFDQEKRSEFLTGFHKRKMQRHADKVARAVARDKKIEDEERRSMREAKREQIKEAISKSMHVAELGDHGSGRKMNLKMMNKKRKSPAQHVDSGSQSESDIGEHDDSESESEHDSNTNTESSRILKTNQYKTTVTVIEDFDAAAAIDSLSSYTNTSNNNNDDGDELKNNAPDQSTGNKGRDSSMNRNTKQSYSKKRSLNNRNKMQKLLTPKEILYNLSKNL
ncbi:Ribosomal RNA-processing protein 17 [Smittium culicis]|uniref:Ribosomal RNA-processing protein 17 n=1 Tax=Smittium culicis TaxID=133412 RepID=A0A1R1Y458_9FUNG|nr:Ribosomal RNA-processing protein 17 [Smittium culicis]